MNRLSTASDPIADSVKEELRSAAIRLGFSACGFTCARDLDLGFMMYRWLGEDRHGHMDYLVRQGPRRLSPRACFAKAASVLVVAWPYPAPSPPDSDWGGRLEGRIAAYALGDDYHSILRRKLEHLAKMTEEMCGAASKVQVDAGPLVEKELARRAGLGWYGHNTNLVTKDAGSYVLLGCLATEAVFEPDPPFRGGHCGFCRDCPPACPTGALDCGPTIDARLCISYLTIEHRGPIAHGLRPRMGNWVFGCDLCQQVCGWNGEATAAVAGSTPFLPDLLGIDEEEFKHLYGATAIARCKRRGLGRNAAVALGNSRNPEAAGPLEHALRTHDQPLVRSHAAWAIGRIAAAGWRRVLATAARHEDVRPVVVEIEAALAGNSQLTPGRGDRYRPGPKVV
jgi:epoxyqueuosine reductase